MTEKRSDFRDNSSFVVVTDPGQLDAKDVCLFVSYCPVVGYKEYVLHHIRQLRASGFAVVLIINTDTPSSDIAPHNLLNGFIVRQNKGFDFGAWADAFRCLPSLWAARSVLLLNDSIYGGIGSYAKLLHNVGARQADIVAMTESFEVKHHYQSYFLLFNRGALASDPFQQYWLRIDNLPTKEEVILTYEVNFLQQCLGWGLRTDCIFSIPQKAAWPHNATLILWKELIASGYPFLKTEVLKRNRFNTDISQWRSMIGDPELLAAIEADLGSTSDLQALGLGSPMSRNAPCPCGSGKRYKHCHGAMS